jgi:YfiR/HmsC-like
MAPQRVRRKGSMQIIRGYWGRAKAAAFLLGFSFIAPARAEQGSLADLKAATRSLGFLQNPSHGNGFMIGVVYTPLDKALAQQVAERLHSLPGPNNGGLKSELISLGDLASHGETLDALYLLPGTLSAAATITEVARRKHLLVISSDPACLDQRCCMLMVRDTGRVEIVLDQALADSAGVSFSSVFAMMVRHK